MMKKYLIIHIAAKTYYSNLSQQNTPFQEFSPVNADSNDFQAVLGEFCSKLTGKFELTLLTDELISQTVNLSQQAQAVNASLLEQFLLFELENSLDILPDNPALAFARVDTTKFHTTLITKNYIEKIQSVCKTFNGHLVYLGHPAGITSLLEKVNIVEVYSHTVHCSTSMEYSNFHINAPLPTEYEKVNEWQSKKLLKHVVIYNLAAQKILPIEGTIKEFDFTTINGKAVMNLLKDKQRPAFNYKKMSQTQKENLLMLVSALIALIFFSTLTFSKYQKNKILETKLETNRKERQSLNNQKQQILTKFAEIIPLENKINDIQNHHFIENNLQFWPAFFETLAKSYDENSQLSGVATEKDNVVIIEGRTLNLLQMENTITNLQNNISLNITVIDKSVTKGLIGSADVWSYKIRILRNK